MPIYDFRFAIYERRIWCRSKLEHAAARNEFIDAPGSLKMRTYSGWATIFSRCVLYSCSVILP
jgi:hypothetical protein